MAETEEDVCPCGWCVAARAMRAPHPLRPLQADAPTAPALPIAALRADRQRIGLFVP